MAMTTNRFRNSPVHLAMPRPVDKKVLIAGIAIGTRVPNVLTRKADSAHARIAACATALPVARCLRPDPQ
jgi:hypothetical protein